MIQIIVLLSFFCLILLFFLVLFVYSREECQPMHFLLKDEVTANLKDLI